MQVGPFTAGMSNCPAAAGVRCTAVPLLNGKPTSSPMSGRPSAHEASTSLTDLQVSGLKSITAKHLALSCQCLSALITLHPVLSLVLMAPVQQPRLGLLQPEFDRVLQVGVLPASRAPHSCGCSAASQQCMFLCLP